MNLTYKEKYVLLTEIHNAQKKYRDVKDNVDNIRDILNWAYDYKENYIDGWELVFDSLLAKFKMFYSKYKDIRCPKCKSLVVYDSKSIRGIDSFVCTKCNAGIDIPWWLIFDAFEEVM